MNKRPSASLRIAGGLTLAVLLAACGSAPKAPPATPTAGEPGRATTRTPSRKPQVTLKRGGGFYKDDGPADDIPDNLDDIPDAEPRLEPLHKPAMKPYVVLGKEYVPNTEVRPYKARGIASWYGKKFHGQKTSIGEPYDMFAMTAAHTTLAIPSYVRVTNVQNGKSVIVRVIDRGPFHVDRIIDLSYTAAWKLDLVGGGSGQVEVEAIVPDDTGNIYAQATQSKPLRPAVVAVASQTTPAESDQIEALAQRLNREQKPVQTVAQAGMAGDSTPPKGVYLQLGAFSNADNAENLKTHLTRELDWVAEPMRITQGGGIHRLHLGPYASRSEADKVAEKIRLALGFKPTFVTR